MSVLYFNPGRDYLTIYALPVGPSLANFPG